MAKENNKNGKPNIFSRAISKVTDFFKGIFSEIKKVTWPSKNQLIHNTLIILAFIIFLLARRNDKLLVLLTCLLSVISNQLIKHIIMRDRPSVYRMIKQGGFSYPSGHSMIAVALYGILIYLVLKYIKNKYLKYGLSALLVLLILSIGISRIYVGVHFASDVVGGFSLAIAEIVLIVSFLEKKLRGN